SCTTSGSPWVIQRYFDDECNSLRPAEAQVINNSNRRKSRIHDLVKQNRRPPAVSDACGKLTPLRDMTFALTQPLAERSFPTVANQVETAKIVKHRDTAVSKDFDPFFGICPITVTDVRDSPQ